jgi:2-keto-3-deoxy-L-rhamnonate aldolase RhmA
MTRITERLASGASVFGAYASFASELEIQVLAEAGLDFVRLDGFKYSWDYQVIRRLTEACRAAGVTAWARSTADPDDIRRWLDAGAGAVTVPSVGSGEQAASIAAAAQGRDEDVLIGCQVETSEGLAQLREIVDTPGIDVIHSGRTDLAIELTGTGNQFAPEVLEAERRIVRAARAAGKQVALMYPVTAKGLEYVKGWQDEGIRLFALDNDTRVLNRVYAGALDHLSGKTGAP